MLEATFSTLLLYVTQPETQAWRKRYLPEITKYSWGTAKAWRWVLRPSIALYPQSVKELDRGIAYRQNTELESGCRGSSGFSLKEEKAIKIFVHEISLMYSHSVITEYLYGPRHIFVMHRREVVVDCSLVWSNCVMRLIDLMQSDASLVELALVGNLGRWGSAVLLCWTTSAVLTFSLELRDKLESSHKWGTLLLKGLAIFADKDCWEMRDWLGGKIF